ncbi:MAG: hypothetical protein ACK4N5_10565, partial [Myxococcales bacterium]
MNLVKSLSAGALALLLGFTVAGCGPDDPGNNPNPTTDAGPCDPNDPTCVECELDSDCGDEALFTCDLVTQKCKPACTQRAQCQAHPAFDGAPVAGCESGLGCVCDERKCVPQACTADTECGAGQVCKSGKCGPADAPDGCKIFPDFAVMRTGKDAQFTVVAYKGNEPVVAGGGELERSAAGGSVQVQGGGVFTGKAANTAGEAHVKATLKSNSTVTCTANAHVFGDPASTEIRVIVVDEMTGRLIPGATVVTDAAARLALTESSSTKGVHTGLAPATTYSLSVFHNDFNYLTLVDLPAATRDLYVPIRRNSGAKVGGYKGKFDNLSKTSDLHFGLSGTSIPGSLTDLDLNVLVGPTQETTITFSGQTFKAPLPSGVVLGLGNSIFKENFQALGVPGVCDDATKTANGDCGTRSAWSIMGDIPISKIPISELTGGAENINIGKLLAQLLPQ